jgi:uncharacterized protein (TIGR04255 family)
MYTGRERYSSPPVSLVAAEIRFGHEPALATEAGINTVMSRLRTHFPLLAREDVETLTMMPGSTEQERQSRWRATAETRDTSVSVTQESVVLETTTYEDGYEGLSVQLEAMCDALAGSLESARIWRMGLRYIDEIRLPGIVSRADQWSDWIAPPLVAANSIPGDANVIGFHGDIAWMTGEQRAVTMRWGTFDQATILADSMPLRRRQVSGDGPTFVLDIDSYWQPQVPPAFSSDTAMKAFEELHQPTGSAFQSCLTEKLRSEFRKERTN